MLSAIYAECSKLAFCAKCRYAECQYSECRSTLWISLRWRVKAYLHWRLIQPKCRLKSSCYRLRVSRILIIPRFPRILRIRSICCCAAIEAMIRLCYCRFKGSSSISSLMGWLGVIVKLSSIMLSMITLRIITLGIYKLIWRSPSTMTLSLMTLIIITVCM